MSYRNVEMDTRSPKFREMYRSVISAVAELAVAGEAGVEVKFRHHSELSVWRRRCYEWQKITGQAFRVEVIDGETLFLRPTRRVVDAHPVTIDGRTIASIRDDSGKQLAREIAEAMTPEMQAHIEEIKKEALKLMGEEHDTLDVQEVFKKGAADARRSKPGGDAADTGSSGGDD